MRVVVTLNTLNRLSFIYSSIGIQVYFQALWLPRFNSSRFWGPSGNPAPSPVIFEVVIFLHHVVVTVESQTQTANLLTRNT